MVAAAGGAPAVSTRTPRGTPRLHLVRRVGKRDEDGRRRAQHRDRARRGPGERRRGLDFAQADVRAADRGDDPDERPAVGVKHRQRPQVAVGRASSAACSSVPTAFIQALRCVIITPLGRDVVPLV